MFDISTGNLSSFPNALDIFQEHMDISFLDRDNLSEYQSLVMRENKTAAEIQRMNELAGILAGKLFKAFDFNKLQDAMYNVQKFFFGELSGWNLLMETVQNQTEEQRIQWNDFALSLETQTFTRINNNFDDLSVRRGCNKSTIFHPNGSIVETITVISASMVLATRLTEFISDTRIKEIVNFYPWEVMDGTNTIITTLFTMSKETIFNADGSITEVIS